MRKLFKGGNYMRKYGSSFLQHTKRNLYQTRKYEEAHNFHAIPMYGKTHDFFPLNKKYFRCLNQSMI